jgi:hypothetical protein
MMKWARSIVSAGLAGVALGSAASATQTSSDAVQQDYVQRYGAINERLAGSDERFGEWSAIIRQLAYETRLSREERAHLEVSLRCGVTLEIDAANRALDQSHAEYYQSAENILNLSVVVDETLNAATDLIYATRAAECLWERHTHLTARARASSPDLPHVGIGLDRQALGSLTKAMALSQLVVEGIERFFPDEEEGALRARITVSQRYFQYAGAARQQSGPFVNTTRILDEANAYSAALLDDIQTIAGGWPQVWFELKTTQITGNLLYGDSEGAAEFALEFVEAYEASGNDRVEATIYVGNLVTYELLSYGGYRLHLDRLIDERW